MRFALDGDSDEYYTPRFIRQALPPELDLDPCSPVHRPILAARHIVGAEGQDGLSQPWGPVHFEVEDLFGRRPATRSSVVFCNPPYNRNIRGESQLQVWTAKCDREFQAGHVGLLILLIPCKPSEEYWWQHILPTAHLLGFIKGRVRFDNADGRPTKDPATFPSCLLVWHDGHHDEALGHLRRASKSWCHWVKL